MVPDYVEYDPAYLAGQYSSLSLVINTYSFSNPFPSYTFIPSLQQQLLSDILANYYVEFYFTSKVITPSGAVKFQLHRAYSTQINIASDYIAASFRVIAGLRSTLMDNSIMPWRNNKNITVMSYAGDYQGQAVLTTQTMSDNGVQQTLVVMSSLEVAVRFYKKLDWLLGIIGGGIFLFYLIFWVFFNFYNRNALKY
jgi:Sec7-like guanine-nucleotide exchange factor